MCSIYGKGFPEAERLTYVPIIYNNIITSMKTLCKQTHVHGPVAAALEQARNHVENELKGGAACFGSRQRAGGAKGGWVGLQKCWVIELVFDGGVQATKRLTLRSVQLCSSCGRIRAFNARTRSAHTSN